MFDTEPVRTRQEGLERLLQAYGVEAKGWTLEQNALCLADGRRVPLMPWRAFFLNNSMRGLIGGASLSMSGAHGTGVRGPSALRLLYADDGSAGLRAMLRQELDLSEWLLGSETMQVFAMARGAVLHVSTRLKNQAVCTLELNAGLPRGTRPLFKHELTTETGFVTDRAVDAQVTPQQMYLFGRDAQPEGFNEWDAYTWGLSPEDATDVRAALALLSGEQDPDAQIRAGKRLDRLCALVWESAETGKCLQAEEVDA